MKTATFTLPTIDAPKALPDLRHWLLHKWRDTGPLGGLFDDSPWVRQTVRTADLWWVEPEACDLLAESAPTWPDDWTLDMHDLPSMAGFAVFAHDLIGTDTAPDMVEGDGTIAVSGIMWGPIRLGVTGTVVDALAIGIWTRHVLHEGLSPAGLVRIAPLLGILGGDAGHELNTSVVCTGDLFAYCGRTDWLDDTGAATPIPDDPDPRPVVATSKAEDRRLLAALWAITKTPVVSVERAAIPRPVARRSTREGLDPTVRVLRLGGTPIPHDGPTCSTGTREYRHQWIVRPHWRWQPFGPGRAERKLILVGPYVKGPGGAPLIGGDRVWKVVPPPRPETPR